MPNCPNCGTVLGMWEGGFICPKSHKTYTYKDAEDFVNFDWDVVSWAIRTMEVLLHTSVLRPGANHVEFLDDGVIITNLGDIF